LHFELDQRKGRKVQSLVSNLARSPKCQVDPPFFARIYLLKLEFSMRGSAPTKSSLNRRSVSGLGLKSVAENRKCCAFETMLFALKNWVFVGLGIG
jgi:hypothetical protein